MPLNFYLCDDCEDEFLGPPRRCIRCGVEICPDCCGDDQLCNHCDDEFDPDEYLDDEESWDDAEDF